VLRTATPKALPRKGVNNKPPRTWTDLSFLNIQTSHLQNQKNCGIYEAQTSFVACGPDNRRWTGYAFVDNWYGSEDLEDKDFCYEGFHEDPIASSGSLTIHNANHPVWNPREYFLMAFAANLAPVQGEWEYLVRTVERSIKSHVC